MIAPPSLYALYRDHIKTIGVRAASALEAHGYDAVVVHAGRVQRKSPFDDAEWPFVAVPMFKHYSPLEWPDSCVVVTRTDVRQWAVDDKNFWERPTAPDWSLIRAGLPTDVAEDLSTVRTSLPAGRTAFVGHEAEAAADLGIDPSDVNPSALVVALEDARVAKTPYEVEIMAAASRRGVLGHRAAESAFKAGERSELNIHLAYLKASAQDDADAPYKGIVALGEAGATLHHHSYEDRPQSESLLIDAGATYLGYPCDITRTYVADGNGAKDAFRALLEGMERVQLATIEDIAVGMNYEALHDGCHRRIGDLMFEQGLVTCSGEAASAQGITRAFFPHGLGHSIGVQVHDVSCRKREPKAENPFLRHTAQIDAGQIFTIEPGFYFIGALMDELKSKPAGSDVRWDRIAPMIQFGGIRIEDNVYVRSDAGTRNLTREAFAANI